LFNLHPGGATPVLRIKQAIEGRWRIPVRDQCLQFDGMRLRDGSLVSDYGVEPGDSLDLSINQVGC
jgi:hypothetical protein